MDFYRDVIISFFAIIGGLTCIGVFAWLVQGWAQDYYDRGR
jgi:hypothetical protein